MEQKQIQFRFSCNNVEFVSISISNHDPRRTTFVRLKQLLVSRCTDARPELSASPFQWVLKVDGVIVGDFDAARKRASELHTTSRVELIYKQQKRRRPEEESSKKNVVAEKVLKIETEPDTAKKYDLVQKLLNILQTETLKSSERDSNGLQTQEVFGLFGHIKTKIVSKRRYFLQTHPTELIPASGFEIVLSPLLIPSHVSLVCRYTTAAKMLNLDSSASQPGLARDATSRTYINYQTFDKTTNINGVELAGGNCSLFTAINAIRCIVNFREYSTLDGNLNTFWEKLTRVVGMSEANVSHVLLNMWCMIMKHRDMALPKIPPALTNPQLTGMLMNIIFENLKLTPNIDYSADIIFLNLFLQTGIKGFEQVAVLGNVLRIYLQDIVQGRETLREEMHFSSTSRNKLIVAKDLFQRTVRSLQFSNDTIAVIRNERTMAVTVARTISATTNLLEVSPLVAESIGTEDPFFIEIVENLQPATRIVFRQLSESGTGTLAYLKRSIEACIEHAPALVVGQVLNLPWWRVVVDEIYTDDSDYKKVSVAGISQNENVDIDIIYACRQCATATSISTNVCGNCYNAVYCDVECQEKHFVEHKKECK